MLTKLVKLTWHGLKVAKLTKFAEIQLEEGITNLCLLKTSSGTK